MHHQPRLMSLSDRNPYEVQAELLQRIRKLEAAVERLQWQRGQDARHDDDDNEHGHDGGDQRDAERGDSRLPVIDRLGTAASKRD